MSQLVTLSEGDECSHDCNSKGGFVIAQAKNSQELTARKNVSQVKTVSPDIIEHTAEKPFKGDQINPYMNTVVDYSQITSQSGIRPIVSQHSMNRYSLDDWRKHNEKVLDCAVISESNILNYNVQTAINSGIGNMDQAQFKGNNLLKQKAKELYRWKVEVELACKAIAKEVELLEMGRQRVKAVCRELLLPEAISKECIALRSNRVESELVADLADQELNKEMELIFEMKETLRSTLHEIDEQLVNAKKAKHRIEYEWCDKSFAHATETNNLNLTINSKTLMFKPGAVKFSECTAPLLYWEYFCRDTIKKVEAVRQTSEDLRSNLNYTFINNGKKMRNQADRTDKALANTIALTSELLIKLEERLRYILKSIGEVELLIKHLQECIKKSDRAMKLAQTRLDNRNNGRPHGENVRDQPHMALLHEVEVIHGSTTSLIVQLKNSEKTIKNLMVKRLELEKEIAAKRKSLNIDRERCGLIRSHYPTVSELSGL